MPPRSIVGYAWSTGRTHQLRLVALTILVFAINLVPLELQRRIVNGALSGGHADDLVPLCVLYLAVNLTAGGLKLLLNVYRGWVAEVAAKALRRTVIEAAADRGALAPEAEGTMIAIVVAEIDPVAGTIGNCVSEPLLQLGTLASVLGYLIYLQPWVALISFALFASQAAFVPPLQRAINRRAATRIGALRVLGGAVADEHRLPFARVADVVDTVLDLNVEILWRKYLMNFLMNALYHLGVAGTFLIGGYLALTGRMQYGAVVAFVSGLGRMNDPWGDLINYARDLATAQVKYQLVRGFIAGDKARVA